MSRTGPKTVAGKRRSSLNSAAHGLNIDGFLPCKKDRCYFISVCLLKLMYGESAIKDIPYGAACPLEISLYERLAGAYTQKPSETREVAVDRIHRLIMLQVKRQRLMLLEALNPGLNRRRLLLSMRYRAEVVSQLYSQMENALSADGGSISGVAP